MFVRDTKLALASCGVGVLVGVVATWIAIGHTSIPVAKRPLASPDQSSVPVTRIVDASSPAGPAHLPSVGQRPTLVVLATTGMSGNADRTVRPNAPPPLRSDEAALVPRAQAVPTHRSPASTVKSSPASTVRTERASPTGRVTPFQGTLVFSSTPSGANISIDGEPVGSAPLVVNRVRAGSRVVRVTAEGYQPWSSAV